MAQAGVAYRDVNRSAEVRRGKGRGKRLNRVMLWATTGLVVGFMFGYIGQLAEISAGAKEIRQIKMETDRMKEEQEQLKINLANQENIDRVWDLATGTLGMQYPVEGQIQIVSIEGYMSNGNTQTAHDNATP